MMRFKAMRRWLGVGAMLWLSASQAAWAVAVGDRLDGFAVKSMAGGNLTHADLDGKVSVINFWATWCEACKVEIVEMEKLLEPLKVKGLNLIFVSLDKDPEKAAAWFRQNLKRADAMLPLLHSDASFAVAEKLDIDSFPLTLVVGKDGRVVHVQRGFKEGDGTTEAMAAMAQKLMGTAAH